MKYERLLVLAAMKEEEASASGALAGHFVREGEHGGRLAISVKEFEVGSRHIFIAQSGMGTVNAALTLATLAEGCQPDAVILLGVGGSITPKLQIGDLVISRQVLQHDYLSSLDFGLARMRPGDLILSEAQLRGYSPAYRADPDLIEHLSAVAGGAKVGTVVSGNEFVGTAKRKLELQALDSEALLVDMEAAGVAQVAHRLRLPFVVAKTVADRLHPDGAIEADFRACLEAASHHAADVLRRLLIP